MSTLIRYLKKFILIITLTWPHFSYANDFEYSKFFHVKVLVKQALEDITLRAVKLKKTKELQTSIIKNLTRNLIGLKSKYNIDFAVISDDTNNRQDLLDKGIIFITVKLRYEDEKGIITWELTSIVLPKEIRFYSVVDDGEEVTEDHLYAYKRLYKE